MLERYTRATQSLAINMVRHTPSFAMEGYWIDGHRFFFVSDKPEPSSKRRISVPCIGDTEARVVKEIMPPDVLAALLSEHSPQAVTCEALSGAVFDMPNAHTLAVGVSGRHYLVHCGERRVLLATASLEAPALYSPDGHYACFVKDYDLWVKDRVTGSERALTTDGAVHCAYGQKSESCLEAVAYRKRPSPVGLWSPDSQWLLTHKIDERSLPEAALVEHAPPTGGRPLLHTFKYPVPGDSLPVARFVAIHVPSGRVSRFDEFPTPFALFSPFDLRRAWFDSQNKIWCVRVDRYSKQADLIQLDPTTGTGRIVLNEAVSSGYLEVNPFINGTPNVRTLTESDEVIWFSERDGWGHLYLYDAVTGALKTQITRGPWLVRDIVHVDEARRRVLFLAHGVDPNSDPGQRSLCAVNLDGSGFENLCSHDGDVYVPVSEPCGLDQDQPFRPQGSRPGVSPDSRFVVVRHSSVINGNVTQIVDLLKEDSLLIASALPSEEEPPVRAFTAFAADGVTRLHGVMFLPPDFEASRSYPLIDYIYPGPQLAWQPQAWRSVRSMQAKALADLGFLVIMLNTRGMPISSREFHQIGYGSLLEPQLADHAAVVRQLCVDHCFVDSDRIGMFGQSGGGAATARAMLDYGDLYKVGVAVCGNHDSSFYVTSWSDKFRGPGDSRQWSSQANTSGAHKLRGKLLLISGDMDENVHLSQTLGLVNALIQANRDFDLLVVPNAGHGVLTTSGYAQRRVWDYFVKHLLGAIPPDNFEIIIDRDALSELARRTEREMRQ